MLTLIKNGEIYAPEKLGCGEVLIAGTQIAAVKERVSLNGDELSEFDASDAYVVPGFVDSLVHIIGGGGEGGFRTRTPELDVQHAIRNGVTTMVGVLGTDAVTRTLTNLLAKARAIDEEGITCLCYTGSYQIPVRTLLNDVMEDIVLIDKFIGVGEVAIADHRSSQPTLNEFKKLTSQARVGGMLAGKAGIVSVHVGDSPEGLQLLEQVVAESDLPITQFYPTHINRNRRLFVTALDYARHGGYIDFTTSTTPQLIAQGEIKCSRGLKEALDAGVEISRITFSSDANASLPLFDQHNVFKGLGVGDIGSLFAEVRDAVLAENIPFESALRVITDNPAEILGLPHKGRLAPGADADLVVVNRADFSIRAVFARGRLLYQR
jgi:beta-aspartyl-dipeptidase (metallo-type)